MKELKDAVGVTNRAFTAMNYINQDGKKPSLWPKPMKMLGRQ